MKRVAMVGVLVTVIYQGFLGATRYEVNLKRAELKHQSKIDQKNPVLRGVHNSASFYSSAALLVRDHSFSPDKVNLETYGKEKERIEKFLEDRQLAFELLRQGAQGRICEYYPTETGIYESGEVFTLRALLYAGCFQMMQLAEKGEFEQTVALGQDLSKMIELVGSSSEAGVIRFMMALSYAERFGAVVDELARNYPGSGFERLQASKATLADVFERALPRTVRVETAFAQDYFEQLRSDDSATKRETANLPFTSVMCDLRITQGELEYLNFAQHVEEKLARGETGALDSEGKELHPLAAAMTPAWSKMADRCREVTASLRKNQG